MTAVIKDDDCNKNYSNKRWQYLMTAVIGDSYNKNYSNEGWQYLMMAVIKYDCNHRL
jgi:hypothetical protein